MKKLTRILALALALCMCFALLVACTEPDPCKDGHNYGTDGKCTGCGKTECEAKGSHSWVNGVCTVCSEEYDIHDYVSELKLDMNSSSAKYEGKGSSILKQYVDGDTTHFWVDIPEIEDGILKARYIAVNTPESTGKVEPYGKIASNFTHDKLQSALDHGGNILLESDTTEWKHDSYGRYLVWVWYQPEAGADYRNLNLELLQNGLAFGSNSGDNRYGETCSAALYQAVQAKLIVQSGLKDETFYYGEAKRVSLRDLRTNIEAYEGVRVAFEGTVTMLSGGGSYVEDYDQETGLVYGMYVYYGTEVTAEVNKWLGTPGTRLLVVGVLTYYNNTSWQVSDVQYRAMKPNDSKNLQWISDGNPAHYQKVESVADFFGYTYIPVWDDKAGEDGNGDYVDTKFQKCELILNTTVAMENLTVVDMYTTGNGGNNDGAISITCRDKNGDEITIRTGVLYKADGSLVTEKDFEGKTISVKGVVDYYVYNGNSQYQIKVLQYSDITFVS